MPADKKHTIICLVVLALFLVVGTGCETRRDGEPGLTLDQRQTIHPKADSFLNNSDAAWRARNYDAMFDALDSAAVYAPDLADIPFRRGRAHAALNQLEDARGAFEQVLEMDPYYPGASYELGTLAFKERQHRRALEDYRREEAMLEALLDRRVPYASARPSALAATRLQMGRLYDRLGKVDSAYVSYQSALAADSTFAEAYYELSRLYETDGEIEKALKHARRAHAVDPGSPDNQYKLGALLLQNDAPEEALPYLQASVAERPWYHPALANLGRALLRLGRQDEAERYLARAERMQALDVDIEQARLDVQQSPDASQRWIHLARLLVEAGRYDEAQEAFNNAIYLEPMNLAFHNDAANLRLLRGDTEGAIQRFRMIVEFDSSFVEAWMNLGVAYAVSEQYDEAERAWQRVLAAAPNHAEARANLDRLSEMR